MIKKVFGITDSGEKIELNYQTFMMVTDNDSKLMIETTSKHPEEPDIVLNVDTGPVVTDEISGEGRYIASEGHRYFNIIPGASNLIFVKVIRKILKK